jgi:hypothetical protein
MHLNCCSIQARRPYQPAALASGGKSVRISQGSVYPSSQQASKVQRSRRAGLLKAVPVPCQRVPGEGTKLRRGREVACGSGRKVPPVLIRKKGCQPKRTIRRNSQPAYRPRSASTMTVQPRGMAGRSWRNIRSQWRRQASGWLAGRIVQATGMAQPR